jgi:hypothetical protein
MKVVTLIVSVFLLLLGTRHTVLTENAHNLNLLALANDDLHASLLGSDCQCGYMESANPTTYIYKGQDALKKAQLLFYQSRYQEVMTQLEQSELARQDLALFVQGSAHLCLGQGKAAADYWTMEQTAWLGFQAIYSRLVQGENEHARALYDFALASQPEIWNGWQGSPAPNIRTYQSAADVARQRGDSEAELHWLLLNKSLEPNSPLVNYRLGEYYERQNGDLEIVLDYYRQAMLHARDHDLSPYIHFLRVSLQLEDWLSAIEGVEDLMARETIPEQIWRRIQALLAPYQGVSPCEELLNNFSEQPSSLEQQKRVALLQEACGQ